MADNGSNGNGASADNRYKKIEIRPQLLESGKKTQMLHRNHNIGMGVQVVASGGETNLHAHGNQDAIWLVLQGKAVFYGEGDKVLANLKKNEAFFIEHGAPYWFESGDDSENLVILRMSAKVEGATEGRVDYGERQFVIAHGAGEAEKQQAAGMVERPVKVLEGRFFGD